MNNGKKKVKSPKVFNSSFLKKAHKASMNNADCSPQTEFGCFHCSCTFKRKDVKELTDKGTTVLCPSCGIDSTINLSSINVESVFLSEMHKMFFIIDGKE